MEQAADPRRDKDFLGHSVSNRQSTLSVFLVKEPREGGHPSCLEVLV